MKTLLTVSFLIFAATSVAQEFSVAYKPGDELYVCSSEGISLRPAPDAKSTKIMVVPFATPVKVLPDTGPRVKFVSTGIPGTWVKVTASGKVGYVFDGFISRYKPMGPPGEEDYGSRKKENIVNHLKSILTVKSETKDDAQFSEKWIVTFTNGVEFNGKFGSIVEINFPASVITFQEAFLLGRSIYPLLFASCPYTDKEVEFVCVVQDEAGRVRKDTQAKTISIIWSQGD